MNMFSDGMMAVLNGIKWAEIKDTQWLNPDGSVRMLEPERVVVHEDPVLFSFRNNDSFMVYENAGEKLWDELFHGIMVSCKERCERPEFSTTNSDLDELFEGIGE